MKQPFHLALILSMFLLTAAHSLFAAEVTNLRPKFSSNQFSVEYDLLGKRGETSSAVEIVLEVHGKRYSSHMLSLSGDFGASIPVGKNRRVVWQHLKDIPEGLDKTFKCIVNAVPNELIPDEGESPSEGFKNSTYAVNRQTIVESRTKLMWTRSAAISAKPMKHSDAEKLVQKLNQERYAGYNDWRMPTKDDVGALVFFGKKEGWGTGFSHYIADYLSACGFTDIHPGNYWTSTASETEPDQRYVANTWNGAIRTLAETNYYYLWPVRNTP